MSEPAKKPEPYELEPDRPPGESRPASGAPAANLNKPPLLDDFEEDADFSKDPEVEAALKAKPVTPGKPTEPEPPGGYFVRPGLGDEKIWGLVGAALLVATLIAVAITADRGTVYTLGVVALRLYQVLVHTATGVIAVWIAATLCEQRLGKMELAAGRMFAAVAALALFFSLRISIFSESPFEQHTWSAIFGAAAYLGLVAGLFRIWGQRLLFVIGSHLGLWLLVQVGLLLAGYVSSVPPLPAAGGQ